MTKKNETCKIVMLKSGGHMIQFELCNVWCIICIFAV